MLRMGGLGGAGERDGVGGRESSHEVYAPVRAAQMSYSLSYWRHEMKAYRLHDQNGVGSTDRYRSIPR